MPRACIKLSGLQPSQIQCRSNLELNSLINGRLWREVWVTADPKVAVCGERRNSLWSLTEIAEQKKKEPQGQHLPAFILDKKELLFQAEKCQEIQATGQKSLWRCSANLNHCTVWGQPAFPLCVASTEWPHGPASPNLTTPSQSGFYIYTLSLRSAVLLSEPCW